MSAGRLAPFLLFSYFKKRYIDIRTQYTYIHNTHTRQNSAKAFIQYMCHCTLYFLHTYIWYIQYSIQVKKLELDSNHIFVLSG